MHSDLLTCIDAGPRHSWNSTGLDIVDDRCVYTARCDWCKKEVARKKQSDPPFRTSVRVKP